MKVVVSPLVFECRVFEDGAEYMKDDYIAAFNIVKLPGDDNAAFISLLVSRKQQTRAMLREIVRALRKEGIEVLYATRAFGHVLPRAVKVNDNTWKLDLTQFDSVL